jgi:hypothetical protein
MKVMLAGVYHSVDNYEADGMFAGRPQPGHYVADTHAHLVGADYRASMQECPYCERPLFELINGKASVPALRIAHVGPLDDFGAVPVVSHRIPTETHRVLACRNCRQAFTSPRKQVA